MTNSEVSSSLRGAGALQLEVPGLSDFEFRAGINSEVQGFFAVPCSDYDFRLLASSTSREHYSFAALNKSWRQSAMNFN